MYFLQKVKLADVSSFKRKKEVVYLTKIKKSVFLFAICGDLYGKDS